MQQEVAGLDRISGVDGVENVDLSGLIAQHMDYNVHLVDILRGLEFGDTSVVNRSSDVMLHDIGIHIGEVDYATRYGEVDGATSEAAHHLTPPHAQRNSDK